MQLTNVLGLLTLAVPNVLADGTGPDTGEFVSKVRKRTLPSEGALAAVLLKFKLSEDPIVIRAASKDALDDVVVFSNTDAILVV